MASKHLLQSLMGVLSSLIGTIVIFIIAGRSLGPSDFGHFSVAYATCSILGIVFDYGYMTRLLKEAGLVHPEDPIILARETLIVKLCLFIGISMGVGLLIRLTGLDSELVVRFWIGICLISVANLFGATLRATGRHLIDTLNIFIANLCAVLLGLYLYKLGASAASFALVVVLAGTLHLGLTVWAWSKFGIISSSVATKKSVKHEFVNNLPYLFDAISQRSFGFLDVMVLSLVAPAASVGLYQAAQKVALAANIFAQPFNNVFIPKLSQVATDKDAFTKQGRKALKIQVAVSLSALIALVLLGPLAIRIIFSIEFSEAGNLMWAFGILVALRYLAASQTLQITALGLQKTRTLINVVCLCVFILSAYPLGLALGGVGVVLSSILASALIGGCAWFIKRRSLANM